MKTKRLLTLLFALFLSLGLLAVPASAVTFTEDTSQSTFAAKPAAPTITLSNVASSGKIKVSWNTVKNASSYKVYRATSKSGTYKLMKTTTGTSFTNTSAVAGKTYYYYVVAVAKNGTTSAKSTIKSRTCDLERPKLTMDNVASSGKIRVTWNVVEGAVKYEVYRATSKDGTYKLMKTTTNTSYTNTSAKPAKTYYYKVKAIASKSSADSAYSSVKSRTCDLAQPVITVGHKESTGKTRITWEPIEGATQYTLYIYRIHENTDEQLTTFTTDKTAVVDNGSRVDMGRNYWVQASCDVSAATSANSEEEYECAILAQPSVSAIRNQDGTTRVSWKSILGASAYQIEIYNADGKLVRTAATTGTVLIDDSVTCSYVVTAIYEWAYGNSFPSKPACSVYGLKLDKTSISVTEGRTNTLTVDYTGTKPLTWSSTNPEVASVSNGEIIAHQAGSAKISVTDGELTATCSVSVRAAKQTILTMDHDFVTIHVGDTYQVPYHYTGSDSLTWITSSNTIAAVDSNGVLTANRAGYVFVDVSDGNIDTYCRIDIVEQPTLASDIDLEITDGPFYDGVTRYAGDYVWCVFRTENLCTDRHISATSSDTSVVSVSPSIYVGGMNNASGFKLEFKKAGTATITVRSEDGAVIQTFKLNIKSGYTCNHGKTHTPEEWAECATNVAAANGLPRAKNMRSWRLFTLTDEQLTHEKAVATAHGFIHEYWREDGANCLFTYQGRNEYGKHVFYEHWA